MLNEFKTEPIAFTTIGDDSYVEHHPAEDPCFGRGIYGAVLRQRRNAVGYKRADDFLDDLKLIGCDVTRSALYRIERGAQEPTPGLVLAANLLLFGNMVAPNMVRLCCNPRWLDPESDEALSAILKKNRQQPTRVGAPEEPCEGPDDKSIQAMLGGVSSHDFAVLINEETVSRDGAIVELWYDDGGNSFGDGAEKQHVRHVDDIERLVVRYLKRRQLDMPANEVRKLLAYVKRELLYCDVKVGE